MERLRQEMLTLVERLEADGDLDAARAHYEKTIRPLEQQDAGVVIALTEMREMLFVHPHFSPEMKARDIPTSIAIIRDELGEAISGGR